MLQIKGIRKVYKTGSLIQEALKGVSLNLRDSEFVAILGQSGSGKTTLLNIIGGLDRYTDGDLVINGISTKRYSDRDWDSYRNHSVGFVFQSYNLIPHQTVLRNVELALTIGGVSAAERTRRATEALNKVGLSEHIHKKPSQLSGGQMQRVAIARALVNDPDILLADEPTGALDSETSIQVMDLLKEVASDRLVVMVTHNPELAETYATRIVTLKDGLITSDSDPYEPEEGESVHQNMGRASMSLLTALSLSFNNLWTKKGRTILVSFAGSIGIIGIALILAISHGANQYIHNIEEESLQDYPLQITDTSFDLASMYVDSMSAMSDDDASESTADEKPVHEWRTITNMFSGVTTNDLKSLKAYFESDECDIDDYVQTIEYDYNLAPYIYREDGDGYRQVNPDNSFTALGLSGTEGSTNGLLSAFSSTDTFFAMPENEEIFKKDFDLKAGSWPQSYNECVAVLTQNGNFPDLCLYVMGLKDFKEFDNMMDAFSEGSEMTDISPLGSYSYDDFLGKEFLMIPSSAFYTYDKDYKVWTDHSGDKKYVANLLEDAEKLKIVGVIQPHKGSSASTSYVGIGYTADLTKHIIDVAENSDIVQQQLQNPDIDVFTGKAFDDTEESGDMDMSSLFGVDEDAVSKIFSFEDSGLDLSGFDLSGLDFSDLDLSGAVSASDLSGLMPQLGEDEVTQLLSGIHINMTAQSMEELFTKLLNGYRAYSADDVRADISAIPSAIAQYLSTDDAKELLRSQLQRYLDSRADQAITEEDVAEIIEHYITGYSEYLAEQGYDADDYTHIRDYINSEKAAAILKSDAEALRLKLKALAPTDEEINGFAAALAAGYEEYADKESLPSASYLLTSFMNYLSTDEAQAILSDSVAQIVDASDIGSSIAKYTELFEGQMSAVMQKIFASVGNQIASALQKSMGSLTSGLSDSLMSAFKFDTDAMADMFKSDMSPEELRDLMISLLSVQKKSYDSNLKKLGYADYDKPSTITIYPKDFDSKQAVKDILADYNKRMQEAGEDDKVIEYTDLVDALMGSVTTIIDVISYILIAFVAISLVVSSIMIGVITYISVLERKKEIGILRAIGASKRNISQVFNAETFIIGALAGVIGIGVSHLLIIPGNLLIHALSGQENINAILPPVAGFILILLSIVLTLIGGIIPSRKAAKSDPVAALRSE